MNAPDASSLLANVRIASPCLARWSDMSGDDRVRFCGQCRKHVYNLSELTAEEAAALIREKEGTLCARFYQRSDGTMLTANCPVGAVRSRQRTRRFALATALGLFLGGGGAVLGGGKQGVTTSPQRSRLTLAWNSAVWKVKGWLGLQPKTMMLGEVCVLPRTTSSVPPPPPSSP